MIPVSPAGPLPPGTRRFLKRPSPAQPAHHLLAVISELKDYDIIKLVVPKLLSKPLHTKLKGDIMRFSAYWAIIFHDKEIKPKKIEVLYNLSAQYGCTRVFDEIHYTLAGHYLVAEEYEKSKAHAEILIKSKELKFQIYGYYYLSHCDYETENYESSLKYAARCIEIYEANSTHSFSQGELEFIATTAQIAATVLDRDDTLLIKDPQRCLYYYSIGAKLNNPTSLHNLAFKYENGEDVLVDNEKAISYYRRAAALNFEDSLINVFNLLYTLKLDYSQELETLKKFENNARVYSNLRLYYSLEYQKKISEFEINKKNKKLPHEIAELGKLVFYYSDLAFKIFPNDKSEYSLGLAYHLGIGVEINLDLAEIYYKNALEKGCLAAADTLVVLYNDKLLATNDFKMNNPTLTLVDADSPDHKPLDPKDALELTNTYKSLLTIQCEQINSEIKYNAADSIIGYKKSIQNILAYELNTLTTDNIVTLIHNIGFLTDKCSDDINFHKSQNAKIFEFISAAEKKLELDLFDKTQVINLIEGLSKLYCRTEVNNIASFIKKLYLKALSFIEAYDSNALTKIVYSATRIDPRSDIFIEIIPNFIAKASANLPSLDLYLFAKLLYAIAILDNAIKDLIKADDIKTLLTAEQLKSNKENDLITYRQLYLASYYLIKSYPNLENKLITQLQEKWQQKLLNAVVFTHTTNFQERVTAFVSAYFIKHQAERIINTLPVDLFLYTTEDKGFILQIDGPSHFLHDHNGELPPLPTQKLQFRNAFLALSHPVICLNYFDWDKLKTEKEKQDFLAKLTDTIGVTLEPKWITPGRDYPNTLFGNSANKTALPNSSPTLHRL